VDIPFGARVLYPMNGRVRVTAMNDSEVSFTPSRDAFAPAYDTSGACGGGPQCSAHGDFCFFCEYAETPMEGGDIVGQLKGLARELAMSKKEMPLIANAVYRAYESGVRHKVEWTRGDGKVIAAPEWTLESIKRHLMYSNEFTGLFRTTVDRIFQSLITRLNETAVDANSGLVHEDHRHALVDTIKQYAAWEKHTAALTNKK